nr:hypothetical protein [uncultured Faecalibacillus sp.]
MDAFYKELYVVYFRKWLFNQQNKTCIVYNDPQNQDTVILEEKNCLCKITFNLHSIIEFTIINKKTNKAECYLHFQMQNLNHACKIFYEMFENMSQITNIPAKKILLTCSGGLTTGYFVEKLNTTAQLLELNYTFQAINLEKLEQVSQKHDLILLAPQVSYQCALLQEKYKNKQILKIPATIFARYDAYKLIELIKDTLENPE